jgi:hypothetical protein
MEAEGSSETSVSYHITKRCQNPEDRDLSLHHRKNLKSCDSLSRYISDRLILSSRSLLGFDIM